MNRLLEKLHQYTAPVVAPIAPVDDTPIGPMHPFYPPSIVLNNYVPNDRDVFTMVSLFLLGWAVILGLTWVVVPMVSPKIKTLDRLVVIWFVLTGTIHFFFEGYFSVNHARMPAAQDLFGQLWKEYSLSDSRYQFSDPFVLCMETVTAMLWGPMSYWVVYLVINNHPLRHPIQGLVCIGQIYGDILYYATSMFDLYYRDVSYCRPEGYYFWFYFFFFNFIWIVIPGLLLYHSFATTAKAFDALKRMSVTMQGKTNGHLKST